jgi:hypothetical protein
MGPRENCRLSDRRLSAKLVPNFVYRGCRVVSVPDIYGRIPGFLDVFTRSSRHFETKKELFFEQNKFG